MSLQSMYKSISPFPLSTLLHFAMLWGFPCFLVLENRLVASLKAFLDKIHQMERLTIKVLIFPTNDHKLFGVLDVLVSLILKLQHDFQGGGTIRIGLSQHVSEHGAIT